MSSNVYRPVYIYIYYVYIYICARINMYPDRCAFVIYKLHIL